MEQHESGYRQSWDICQEQQKAQCAESLTPQEIPVRPWQIVVTYLFQVNGYHYMLVVDYFSKYPLVKKLKEFSSQETINLSKKIFDNYNGPHYNSTHF